MPVAQIDNINIRYEKEKHILNHFDVAIQFRNWLNGRTNTTPSFTIINEGQAYDYSYIVFTLNGSWRVHTRQVWINEKVFKNVIYRIDVLHSKD